MPGVGDVPQPDRAVVIAAGQDVPVRAELSQKTAPVPAVRNWPSGGGVTGSAAIFQSWISLALALANVRPSGLNATNATGAPFRGLAELPGVGGIGDIPQPDGAVAVAAGQRAAVGAERDRDGERRRRRSGAGRAGGGGRDW